jgi:putative heme-binding domain-containing protein
MLLLNVESGALPARLLQDRGLRDKVLAAKPNSAAQRINLLTKDMAPANAATEKLIEERRRMFEPAATSAERGKAIFTQTCATCHRLDGAGNLVGPQLDGIGNRGLERLLEDILDPNRNVDRAFRSHLITLKSGDVVTGLPRREEGEMLVLADSAGKEFSVRFSEIESRRESELSPMPTNLGDMLPADQLNDLLAFLLAKRSEAK